jgi:hypothetical protein
MAYAFLTSFVGGLMLGVFAMLNGVQRPIRGVSRARRKSRSAPPLADGRRPAPDTLRAAAQTALAGGAHSVDVPSALAPSDAPPASGGPAVRAAAPLYRFALDLPTAAGFAAAFGATGYLLARYSRLGPVADVAIAAAAGAAGAAGALTLVAAWAIPAAKSEVVDERYVMQGAFARVTAVSDLGATGTVVYESDGESHTTRAAAIDDARLEVGGDVVIERIEAGVAYVEPWARVEARL